MGPWVKLISQYICGNQADTIETVQKFGFFHRVVSSTQWPHILIRNSTPHCFIGKVKVKGDPLQLVFIDMRSNNLVYLGREMKATLTIYSDCERGGYWEHPTIHKREIPAYHTMVLKEKHFTKKSSQTIENIPGFEMKKKTMKSIKKMQESQDDLRYSNSSCSDSVSDSNGSNNSNE